MESTSGKNRGSDARKEARALSVSKWGNLFMGAAGVLAAWASNSQALLVDGLFSLVGFAAAICAARVSVSIKNLPDARRPLGYAADESLYTTFRSLSLLGLIAFAAGAAILNIIGYSTGGVVPELRYDVILVYFVFIFLVCVGLAVTHHSAWVSTGRNSEVLRLEKKAAIFNGILTVAAGVGLSVMPFLKGSVLGWITPIGDSLIVLVLCGLVVGHYLADFRKGLDELAGVSVSADLVMSAQNVVQFLVDEIDGRLVDLSVVRYGRMFQVQLYFDPTEQISTKFVDELTRKCDSALSEVLGHTTTVVLISAHGRVLPESGANT